jgi:hypothetical protein
VKAHIVLSMAGPLCAVAHDGAWAPLTFMNEAGHDAARERDLVASSKHRQRHSQRPRAVATNLARELARFVEHREKRLQRNTLRNAVQVSPSGGMAIHHRGA